MEAEIVYRCTCIICSCSFEISEPYDVCSMACEAKRWQIDARRSPDRRGYRPLRDDVTVKPVKKD